MAYFVIRNITNLQRRMSLFFISMPHAVPDCLKKFEATIEMCKHR